MMVISLVLYVTDRRNDRQHSVCPDMCFNVICSHLTKSPHLFCWLQVHHSCTGSAVLISCVMTPLLLVSGRTVEFLV